MWNENFDEAVITTWQNVYNQWTNPDLRMEQASLWDEIYNNQGRLDKVHLAAKSLRWAIVSEILKTRLDVV